MWNPKAFFNVTLSDHGRSNSKSILYQTLTVFIFIEAHYLIDAQAHLATYIPHLSKDKFTTNTVVIGIC